MAIAGVKEDIGGRRLEQLFHAFFASRNEGAHAGVRQVSHRPLHGVHDFIGDMGWPR